MEINCLKCTCSDTNEAQTYEKIQTSKLVSQGFLSQNGDKKDPSSKNKSKQNSFNSSFSCQKEQKRVKLLDFWQKQLQGQKVTPADIKLKAVVLICYQRFQEAIYLLKSILKNCKKHNQSEEEIQTNLLIAKSYISLKKLDKAIDFLDCIKVESLKEQKYKGLLFKQLSDLYKACNKKQISIDNLIKYGQIIELEVQQNSIEYCNYLYELGSLYYHWQMFKESISSFRKCQFITKNHLKKSQYEDLLFKCELNCMIANLHSNQIIQAQKCLLNAQFSLIGNSNKFQVNYRKSILLEIEGLMLLFLKQAKNAKLKLGESIKLRQEIKVDCQYLSNIIGVLEDEQSNQSLQSQRNNTTFNNRRN